MKLTEKLKNKKINIHLLNRMLAVVAIVVLGLLIVLGFLYYRQERELDLTEPYVFNVSGDAGESRMGTGRADSFASGLCVSDENVPLEGVTLNSPDERALLFNLETGESLFAQNIYQQSFPASITKIMTAVLALENGNMADPVTITQEDLNLEDGSQMSGLEAGDRVTMDQLYHALVVYSANDAAMAIARHVGGTVENFVTMMNDKAAELGMTGTHFSNPHGLHVDDHYTTAYDVYLMLSYASGYQQFMEAVHMSSYHLTVTGSDGNPARTLNLSSTDHYLTGLERPPQGVTVLGGKTGTTPEAGSNLAIIVQNAYGIPYMAIVMNAQNSTALYEDMDLLLSQINK